MKSIKKFLRRSRKKRSKKVIYNDGLEKTDTLFKPVQAMKELICWVINMDIKIYDCLLQLLKENDEFSKKTCLDSYEAYNYIINSLLKNINSKLRVLSYKEFEICSILKWITTDDDLRNLCFDKKDVKDEIKTLIKYTNKKLELLILVMKNNINKKSWFSSKKVYKCETLGQASAQIILILKELQNNGLSDYLSMQKEIASELNSLTKLLM